MFYIIHYSEIGLKGKNRPFFEKQLIDNIQLAFKDEKVKVKRISGRLILEAEIEQELAIKTLQYVFGIKSIIPVVQTDIDVKKIGDVAVEFMKDLEGETFKVTTKRSNKSTPFTSQELSAEVGGMCLDAYPKWSVKMKNADKLVYIEIVEKWGFVGVEKIAGSGGLPVGVSGTVLCLLSGGIDSPVAAWRMMRRGCDVKFIHFHSHPYTDQASVDKVKELADLLGPWQRKTEVHLIPFLDIQKQIVTDTKSEYRVVLYRRFMFRIAEVVAKQVKALGLVTGENLGQVASQTLENMSTITDVVDIPIYRPLISYDKEEIIKEAERIGTYELSIIPHGDCCSLFTPRSPVTRSNSGVADGEEGKMDVDGVIEDAMGKVEVYKV